MSLGVDLFGKPAHPSQIPRNAIRIRQNESVAGSRKCCVDGGGSVRDSLQWNRLARQDFRQKVDVGWVGSGEDAPLHHQRASDTTPSDEPVDEVTNRFGAGFALLLRGTIRLWQECGTELIEWHGLRQQEDRDGLADALGQEFRRKAAVVIIDDYRNPSLRS
nr:hypothetical protein [Rhodococcus wratislaviensis]